MAQNNFTYNTIASESFAEFSDRGSKFLAYSFPADSLEAIKKHIKSLKELHPKAVHYCYAYRLGFDQNEYRASDDGEPSGSAGRPILGQIDSAGLTNVLIVVVRYFGGVLLGVPGLINAYKAASRLAITQTSIIKKNRMQSYLLTFDYTNMNNVMRILKMHSCEIRGQSSALFFEMKIDIALFEEEIVIQKLQKIPNLEISKI